MPICPKCNTEQPEGLNFCTKCGTPLGPVQLKKGIPVKGILFGGCGCIALITIVIGIVVVLAIVMMNLQKRGPEPSAQPPIVQPQPPAIPTEPTLPQKPVTPPVAPKPSPQDYYKVNKGEIIIVFAKGLTPEGLPTETTRTFSCNDPQIVEIICWGPNTLAVGTSLTSIWYYNNQTAVYNNYYSIEEGRLIAVDALNRPASGFPPGEYTVYVGVNGTAVLSHSFTVK